MRDYKKFCRPKFTNNPQAGDILLKLNCGEEGAISQEEYEKVQDFFTIESFVGETTSSSGKIVTRNKELDTTAIFDAETYTQVKDNFEMQEIIGEKDADPINNQSYVDLGLPSGTLWATTNIGASNITDVGDYYSWGELEPTDDGDWEDYDFAGEGTYVVTKYNSTDNITVLEPEDDISNVILGGGWKTATLEQIIELNENTTGEFVTNYQSSGTNGLLLTSTINGNTIFFPAEGYITDTSHVQSDTTRYWTGDINIGNESNAKSYSFNSSSTSLNTEHSWIRSWGFLIRATVIPSNSTNLSQVGDIICYNSVLDKQAIFSYSDWMNLDESWDTIDIYGVETFDNDDEVTEERYVIMANGTTFIIKSEDYSKISSGFEIVDTLSAPNNDFVDLDLPSGLLWTKGNIVKDANGNYSVGNETDYGCYFSWGNVEGHNEGEGYNFDQTTYDSTPGKQVSADIASNDSTHDAALATLGGSCRMPTKTEFQELYDNTDTEWTTIDGVAGRKFMKKSDHSVYIFFSAAGLYNGTTLGGRGSGGLYWSASRYSDSNGYNLDFSSGRVSPQNSSTRRSGFSVRAVSNSI